MPLSLYIYIYICIYVYIHIICCPSPEKTKPGHASWVCTVGLLPWLRRRALRMSFNKAIIVIMVKQMKQQ